MEVALSDYLLMLNSSSQAPNNFETEKSGSRHTCESSGSRLGSPDGVGQRTQFSCCLYCQLCRICSIVSIQGWLDGFHRLPRTGTDLVRWKPSGRCTSHRGRIL